MATTYHELVIKGDRGRIGGFIDGFMTVKKITSGVIVASRHPIRIHHLKEMLKFHGDCLNVIVAARHHRALVSAMKEAHDIECAIVSDTKIKGAHFSFKFHVFNREVATGIRKALEQLPSGVTLTDYTPRETIDPSARGVEIYSPVHEYSFEGDGTIRGDIETLLGVHERLAAHTSIETKDIELEHGAR
jgi:hypothetical protein